MVRTVTACAAVVLRMRPRRTRSMPSSLGLMSSFGLFSFVQTASFPGREGVGCNFEDNINQWGYSADFKFNRKVENCGLIYIGDLFF